MITLPVWPNHPEDTRVYLIAPLLNAVLSGMEFTDTHRKTLKEFPELVKLVDYYLSLPKDARPTYIGQPFFGPKATVDSVSKAMREIDIEIREGRVEQIYPKI